MKEPGRFLKQATGYKMFHFIKSFAMRQRSRRDTFNRTKPDRMMKRKIPVTNPQHQTYTVKNASLCTGEKQTLK